MNDDRKTKAQLIEELRQTRRDLQAMTAIAAELRAAEATLKLFVEHTPAAVAMFDTEMRYLAASRRWLIDYQLGDRPLIGISHYEIFPEIGEDWKAVHRRCLAGAMEKRADDPFPRADGSLDWVRWEVWPWHTATGEIGGIIIFTEVITQQKQAELALLESEKRFRVVQDLSPDAFTILQSVRDSSGQIIDFEWTYANPAAGRILKHPPEELIGQRLLTVLPGNLDVHVLFNRYVRIAEGEPGDEVELEYHSDAISGWFRNLAVKLNDGVAVSFTDITQRKQTEAALRDSERRYQTLFSEMMLGCSLQEIICDEHGQPIDYLTLDVNPAFERLLGVSKATVVGTRASTFLPPAELSGWLSVFGPVALTGVPARYRQGSVLNGKTFEGVVFSPQPRQFAVMFEDITKRQQAEETIRSQLAEITAYYDNAPIGLVVLSPDLHFLRINTVLAAINGLPGEAHLGKTVGEVVPTLEAQTYAVCDHILQTGEPVKNIEVSGETPAQPGVTRTWLESWYPLRDAAGTIAALMGVVEDITDRKRAEIERQALLEIMQGAVVAQNLSDFLQLVHQAIATVIYSENFFVTLYNSDTGLFEEVYSVDKYDLPAMPSPLEGSISAYVFRTGLPLLLTPEHFADLMAQGEVRLIGTDSPSWLGVPLKTASQVIGVMVVQDYEHRNRYSDRDTEFLVSIAGQVALVVERQRTEAAVRELSRYNRSLIEVSLDPLVMIGWDGKITDVNAATEKATGYSRQELIGTDFSSYFTDPARAQASYEQVFRDGQVRDYELELRHRTGAITAVLYNASVYRDEVGQVLGVFAAARDITDRKRVEQALRISQNLLTETERLGHVGGWEFNIDTQQQTWTEEVYRIHELEPGRPITVTEGINFYTPDSRPIIARAAQRAIEHGEPFDVELDIQTAQGNRRYVHAIGKADLEHRRIYGFFQDVTARKHAEAALRELSRYNRSLIEVSLDPLVTIGWDGKITDVNAAAEKATGYSRQELIGTDFSSYFTDPARAQASYEQVFRDGQVRDYELELRHRTGAITAVLYNASVYRDEAGQVLGVFAAARDITDRKRAERAEREQRQLAEALRDTAQALTSTLNLDEVLDRILISMDRVITYDAADILLLDNDGVTARVARHRSHYPLNNLDRVMQLRLPLAQTHNLREMLATRAPVIVADAWNYPGWINNESSRWIRCNLGLPIIIQDHPIGFLSVDSAQPNRFSAADVEHLRAFADQVATAIQNAQLHARIQRHADELEQRVHERTHELADANLRLQELDRMKDEFVARLGHELRTPLTNIKIYLELLEAGKPDKREKYLTTLKREADRLHVLIEDLLRVQQLSADAFEPELGAYDVNQLIADRVVAWSEQAARHGLEFDAHLAADLLPALIDRDYTAQVLGHLISNAVNYTPDGTITLSTASRSDAAGRWIVISVQDTGPGILPDDLSHLFERFYRGQAAADYKTPGTGVGLFLSREIVTKMNGRLLVETEVGVGSIFTLWLPAATP
ncbi:MAG: PAS domain S-box protein [Anaerolineae bacterium]